MRFLRSEKGLRLISSLAGCCDLRIGIFIFLLPIILIRIGLGSIFQGGHSWDDFLYFLMFFLIGYILPSDTRFAEWVKKHGRIGLDIGLVGFGVEGILVLGLGYNIGGSTFSLLFVLFEATMSIGCLGWVIFVLSIGAKYLNFNNNVLAYGNEAVLPFYIFHQTIILCVGWFVIRWNIGILLKYLIIVIVSFSIIMALYEGIVRRFDPVRFLFGMRPRKKQGDSILNSERTLA